MPALYLGHAVAAVLLLFCSGLPRKLREQTTVAVAVVGTALGLALVFGYDNPWRTTQLDRDTAMIVGTACACAWVLAAVLGPGGDRWRTGALVGVGCTGLALFAANRWAVPALLFWLVSSAATVALALRPRGQGVAVFWIGAADAVLIGGLIAHAVQSDSWRLSGSIAGWPRWAVLGALLARAGVVPRIGIWQTLRSSAAAAVPLAAGGAFISLGRFVGGPLPWTGVGLMVAAVAVLAWSLWGRTLVASTVGAWPVLLMTAAALISPATIGRAGVTACLAATLIALWPSSAGRARVPRGFGIALLPPFVGFGVVLSAAVVAFDRAADAPTTLRSAPWTAAAAILPLAVAGGVLLGLNAALQSRAAPRDMGGAIATWVVTLGALVAGFVEPGGFLDPVRIRILYIVAVAVGLGATYASIAVRHEDEIGPIAEGPDATLFDAGLVAIPSRLERALTWFAAAALAAAALGVGWLTLDGLRNGFLS
jgi:hypothetical protein